MVLFAVAANSSLTSCRGLSKVPHILRVSDHTRLGHVPGLSGLGGNRIGITGFGG
jgi:hypothetical protein